MQHYLWTCIGHTPGVQVIKGFALTSVPRVLVGCYWTKVNMRKSAFQLGHARPLVAGVGAEPLPYFLDSNDIGHTVTNERSGYVIATSTLLCHQRSGANSNPALIAFTFPVEMNMHQRTTLIHTSLQRLRLLSRWSASLAM